MIPGALATSYESGALHRRALEALKQRQDFQRAQASEQGEVLSPWQIERPDPNMGMMNDLSQALDEQGSKIGKGRVPQMWQSPVEDAWKTNPANPQGPSYARAALDALMKQKYPGAGV